jgi:protein-disulfide isomerase
MTDNNITKRLPIIFAVIGVFLLSSTAVYLFGKKAPSEAGTETVSKDAEQAIAASGMSVGERKATEAVVRAYILEHPEIIQEAANALQKREVAKRLSAAGNQLSTPFAGAVAGNLAGDVTIVEFTDYNCGFCRSSMPDVERLIAADKGIKLVYREVPILAQTSKDAALWALAAAKQGKHAAFHKAMFSGGRPGADTIRAAASVAGLDMAAATTFVSSKEAVAELQNNLGMMQQIGFTGTPTFIIGDQIIEGALGYDVLKAAVEKARKAKS